MIRPAVRSVLLLAAGLPVALIPAFFGGAAWPVWAVFLAASLAAVGAELARLMPRRYLKLEVESPSTIEIGAKGALRLTIGTSGWRTRVRFEVLADLDPELERVRRGLVEVSGGGALVVEIPLVPRRRGRHRVRCLWLRWWGPLGLLQKVLRVPLDREVAVVPNIGAVRDTALRFFSNREFLSGLKVERYVGDGSEFESLREYLPGFDHRAIDWKASARHRKLLCREYRAERNHQVILALDSGYLMREPLDGVPRLDHAITAGLLLSYVCLKGGDRVGFFHFDERVRSYVEPQGGVYTLHRLQARATEIAYTTAETNFTLGVAALMTRLRRRSLIVLLTEFADTVTAELMIDNVELLARRHLVAFVTLRDPALQRVAEAEPSTIEALNRVVIAEELMREREVVHRRLARAGVHCLDALPGQVPAALVNRYLDIRRRELI